MSEAKRASLPKRSLVLAYGAICYAVGVVSLVHLISLTLGVMPFFGLLPESAWGTAAFINFGLLFAFAAQHSVMARKKFKERWVRVVGEASERSTFVLATGLVLTPMLLAWQPMDGVLWSVESTMLCWAIHGVALLGWGYLFAASFAIDHFELFGLRQVFDYFRGREHRPAAFKERWMYRYDRHPIMTGVLLGLWATPQMTFTHLALALGLTSYVFIGVYFEERALRRDLGSVYEEYAARVGSLVPFLGLFLGSKGSAHGPSAKASSATP